MQDIEFLYLTQADVQNTGVNMPLVMGNVSIIL